MFTKLRLSVHIELVKFLLCSWGSTDTTAKTTSETSTETATASSPVGPKQCAALTLKASLLFPEYMSKCQSSGHQNMRSLVFFRKLCWFETNVEL